MTTTNATTATTGRAAQAAHPKSVPFESAVFPAELDAIQTRHDAMGPGRTKIADHKEAKAKEGKPLSPTTELDLAGIACSGGGNRSATFCLGVLQGLQSKGVVDRMDYLSTVSGGGYIGTTLTIGLSRNQQFPFGRVGRESRETPEVRHLRDHSRYLVYNGLPSVFSALVIYLRGLMTGVLVILPILLVCAAILVFLNPNTFELTHASVAGIDVSKHFSDSRLPITETVLLVLGVILVGYALGVSAVPVAPLDVRSGWAKFFTWVFVIGVVIVLLEIHTLLLRLVFELDGNLRPPQRVGSDASAVQVFEQLYNTAQAFAIYVAPFVVAVLPFLKRLVASATSGEKSSWGGLAKKLASKLLLLLAAAVVPVLLWLAMMQLAYWGTELSMGGPGCELCVPMLPTAAGWSHAPGFLQSAFGQLDVCFKVPVIYCGVALVCFLLWLILSANANSLHQLYRDRLARAFVVKRSGHNTELDDRFKLTEIDSEQGPYHLINAALNVPGSAFANRRGRNADFFIFSQRYIGSEATGYASTKNAEQEVDGLNIGTAMAISGAAAAPNMGMASIRFLSPTIAFLNVRLGRWIRHPHDIELKSGKKRRIKKTDENNLLERIWINWRSIPRAHHLLYEAFAKSGRALRDEGARSIVPSARAAAAPLCDWNKPQGFVFLTDGGHIDNLGIYELLRRRCRLIIAIDAEADPDLNGGSLVQVERFARIDLNVIIRMNWKPIAERTRAVSAGNCAEPVTNGPHVAVGLIEYPPADGDSPANQSSGGTAGQSSGAASQSGGGTAGQSSSGTAGQSSRIKLDRKYGVLVYIKSSLTGDENDYVTAYKRTYPSFPHESTADQLFSEEQFEVYRALGEHIARRFVDGTDEVAVHEDDRDILLAELKRFLPEADPR